MAKKIRFPLEMENEVQVRSLEELKNNFSLEKVLMYYDNGRLDVWLRDRYYSDIAEALDKLDRSSDSFNEELCNLFGVEYNKFDFIDLDVISERNDKLKKLAEFTDDKEYRDVIDSIAFEQDDIYDLIDEGQTTIYLCGSQFEIPFGKEGIKYIGINNPTVIVNSKSEEDCNNKKIVFEGVKFNNGQDGLSSVKYVDTYIYDILNKDEAYLDKKESEKLFNLFCKELFGINLSE